MRKVSRYDPLQLKITIDHLNWSSRIQPVSKGEQVGKVSQAKSDGTGYGFRPLSEAPKNRLDLNNLLMRVKEEERKSKKLNIFIFSGATTVVLIFLMLLSV